MQIAKKIRKFFLGKKSRYIDESNLSETSSILAEVEKKKRKFHLKPDFVKKKTGYFIMLNRMQRSLEKSFKEIQWN